MRRRVPLLRTKHAQHTRCAEAHEPPIFPLILRAPMDRSDPRLDRETLAICSPLHPPSATLAAPFTWNRVQAALSRAPVSKNVAWLFPGQGSQLVGMAKDIVEASAPARAIFARADEALGESLSKLILEGPEDALTRTANAQPAIVTTSIAILAAIRERIPDLALPLFGAGHSLGEYSALVAADALVFEDAVRLVRARGLAMQDAVPEGVGAMAAIMGIDETRLRELCVEGAHDEVVTPANFNTPGQIVIAGAKGAVARVSELVSAEKGKAIPLKVSAPFHCALMAPAARVVERELSNVTISTPKFPIVANFDAAPNSESSRVKDLLTRQVDGAVKWEQAMRFMHGHGVTHALEIGPGKVLAGFTKRIAKEMVMLSVSDTPSLDQVAAFLAAS
jgi:[acyl-carrier-protein] S-malonyltransferase